ncbi:peptidase M23B [Desulfosudis oleivorans Hxd3]|uniref:Peptidase M23B n=2 Tax=Desulfosudis TaxID=2904716 RepID=A8ZX14_DESOH|nr:peptidase M23B [Desulfosudis oleivorans Hxd3]
MRDHMARKRKTITFSIFDETAYSSRQYTFSHAALISVGVVLLIGVALFASLFVQGVVLRHTATDSVWLENKITGQQQQIDMRNQQIALLESKLTSLTGALSHLEAIESDIRRIARIERTANHENLFGVGGSKSETTPGASENDIGGSEAPADQDKQGTKDPAGIFYAAKQNRLTLVLDHSDFIMNPMTCLPLAMPAEGDVTHCFFSRPSPSDGHSGSRGVEIVMPGPAEVVASANGIVTYAGERKPFGHMVVIDHGHGFTTRYTQLTAVAQKPGSTVKKDEPIGFVDNPGNGTPARVFYEVLFNGVQVNPDICLSARLFSI